MPTARDGAHLNRALVELPDLIGPYAVLIPIDTARRGRIEPYFNGQTVEQMMIEVNELAGSHMHDVAGHLRMRWAETTADLLLIYRPTEGPVTVKVISPEPSGLYLVESHWDWRRIKI